MLKRIFRAMNETEYFFKMLADTTRLRCLMLMQTEGELCVCELSHALNLSQPKISRHLALLRESGMLVARRSGTWMHYRINPDMAAWTLDILQTTANSICETEPFTADIKMLNSMKNRPEAICCS